MNRFALMAAASFLSLSAAQAGDISGVVTDGSGAIPLEGAEVTILENGRRTFTGRDGSFSFAGLDAGTYTVEFSYLGADSVSQQISLESADDFADLSVIIGEEVALNDSIVVTGQRGSLNAALNQERASDNLIEVLSSDAIGSLPDENAAEAIRRAVGTNILNDQGEGRFVSIRGLDPALSSVSVNGVRAPSPEGDERSVPLDVIDAEVLERIIITKALTPDMDGDAIGGNIEIRTLSGLDQNDTLFTIKLGSVYTDQTEEFGERFSGAYADNFLDGRLGIAGSISWQSREFGSENKELDDGAINFDEAVPFAEELELRDYVITRERLSLSGNVDYMLTDNHRVYISGFYNDFRDQEFRSRVEAKFDDGDFISADGNTAFLDGIEVDRDIKDREETQQLISIVAGNEWTAPWGEFDAAISFSRAEEEEPNRLDAVYRNGSVNGLVGIDMTNPELPRLAFNDAAGFADYFNTDSYDLDGFEIRDGITEDEEFGLQFNARFNFVEENFDWSFKTGAKFTFRDSERDLEIDVYGDDFASTLTDVATQVKYELDGIGATPDAALFRQLFADNQAGFAAALDDDDTTIASNESDFEASEDIYAAYGMATADFGALRVVGGLRVEHTEFEGTGRFINEEDLDNIADVSGEQSYTDVLPSINARYEMSDNVIARASYFRSVTRPSMTAQTPSVLVNDDDEAELGNPDLDRQAANNFDASLEWYPSNTAVLSGGIFYKDISDVIAIQNFENFDSPLRPNTPFAEATLAVNLDEASLFGVELNYQQALEFLPAPFDGMIVGANYTYVDSEVTIFDADGNARDIALPRQSENVVNGVIGYDKGCLDLRAALTYRGEFIDELNFAGEGVDRVVSSHLQLDLDAKVEVTDRFQIFAGFKNVNDEAFLAVARYNEGDFLSQFEEYGWSTRFGIRYRH